MYWKRYQEETASFFRSLGCDVEVDATVKGARAKHKVDVLVRFRRFGLETKWVVECKLWQTSVPKEKVLALKSTIEDVGADRGILVSSAGFQSGAVRAATSTNISLTSLDELKETAEEELVSSVLHTLETRVIELKYALSDLYSIEQTTSHFWISMPLIGVDSGAVYRAIGALSFLEFGFDRARLRKPPYPIKFGEPGQGQFLAMTLEEFVEGAAQVICEAQTTLNSQHPGKFS